MNKVNEFDEFADDYREIHTRNIKHISGTDTYYFAEYKVREIKKFENKSGLRVLDIGCGDGITESFFLKHFPSWEIQAIDVSERSIETARNKKLTNALFNVYNGDIIPFEDASFDIVFMAGVLHHVTEEKRPGLLKEVFRVLKSKGRFYLFEHNPINPVTMYAVNTCEFDVDAKLLYHSGCKQLLREQGFNTGKARFTLFFPRHALFNYFLFLEKYLYWLPLGGQYYFRCIR